MKGSSPSYVVWYGVWCVLFDVSPEFCLLFLKSALWAGLFLRNGFLKCALWAGLFLRSGFLKLALWAGLFSKERPFEIGIMGWFFLRNGFLKSALWTGLFPKNSFLKSAHRHSGKVFF